MKNDYLLEVSKYISSYFICWPEKKEKQSVTQNRDLSPCGVRVCVSLSLINISGL